MWRQTMRNFIGWTILGCAMLIIAGSLASLALAAEGGCCGGGMPDPKVLLRHTMHKLWAENGLWMRAYLVASVAGTADASEAASRLLRNQEEIGNAVVPFYGVQTGERLTDLLKAQNLIALDAIEAAKSGNRSELQAAEKKWHGNAVELATFLNQANSNWRVQNLVDTLDRNLSLMMHEVNARLQKNWKDDIVAADKNLDIKMTLAGGFAEGIIQQFPAKFSAKF